MKKLIIFALLAFMLIGCASQKKYDEFGREVTADPVSDEEKIIIMINECTSTYNNNQINDIQQQYSTTLPTLPIEVGTLPTVENFNQLTQEENVASNADYIYKLPIDDKYSMQFQLYQPLNSIWLDSNYSFQVDIEQITKDDPNFAQEKELLDNLLNEQELAINLLYASGITLGDQHPTNENYFEVAEYNSIDQIKSVAENVFTQDYLNTLYDIAFYQENPIYLEENGILYASDTSSSISTGIPYNTSYIIATSYEDNRLLIDLAAGYQDDIMPQIYRIELVDEGNGYRLINTY